MKPFIFLMKPFIFLTNHSFFWQTILFSDEPFFFLMNNFSSDRSIYFSDEAIIFSDGSIFFSDGLNGCLKRIMSFIDIKAVSFLSITQKTEWRSNHSVKRYETLKFVEKNWFWIFYQSRDTFKTSDALVVTKTFLWTERRK